MIASFNSKQVILAILNIILGLIAYGLTFAFFYFGFGFIIRGFGLDSVEPFLLPIVILLLILVSVVAYRRWHSGKGHEEYARSGLYVDFGDDSYAAGAAAFYMQQITGPAHVLSQVALAGPLQFLKAIGRFRSLLPADPGLERELKELLEEIRAHGKWHHINDYPGRELNVIVLVQMGKVDLNPRNGKLKIA